MPAPYNVTETILDPASGPAAPLITVRASAAPELTRDDWALAEGAARDHCTGQGARFELLPATRAYTQVQYDDGLWSFVARCAG